jgi:hypothetical protein
MPKGLMDERGYVLFGDELNEKALNALRRNSPTADVILKAIPKEAFIQAELEEKALLEKIQKELKIQVNEPVIKEIPSKPNRLQLKKMQSTEIENVNKTQENNVNVYTENRVNKDTIFQDFIDNFDLCTKDFYFHLFNYKLTLESLKLKEIYKYEQIPLDILEKYSILFEKVAVPLYTKLQIQRELTMNLDDELESLANETSGQNENPEVMMKQQIFELLENRPDAPSANQIKIWKDEYGQSGIHVMAFGQDDVYVYHHLTRKQWRTIKEIMSKLDPEQSDEVEEKLKEKVCLGCVLYPKLDTRWVENCKAGVVDSLYQMILLNSGFLTPQQAMLLTAQL